MMAKGDLENVNGNDEFGFGDIYPESDKLQDDDIKREDELYPEKKSVGF